MSAAWCFPVVSTRMIGMAERQQRNVLAARAFYDAGPTSSDGQRRAYFAETFVWHVPGDTDLSGPYSGQAYFVDMPARMHPWMSGRWRSTSSVPTMISSSARANFTGADWDGRSPPPQVTSSVSTRTHASSRRGAGAPTRKHWTSSSLHD